VQIGILEPSDFSQKAVNKLKNIGNVSCFDGGNLDTFLHDKEILFIRLGHHINNNFLSKTEKLQYLCTPTTGFNHIDMNSVLKRNIIVVSLKGEDAFLSQIRATPEHAFGLVLALLRRYKYAFLTSGRSEWNRDKYKGEELFGNIVGIIGFGRIGNILANWFHCFGAKVYFYDTKPSILKTEHAQRIDALDQMLALVNIVVLAASYSESNRQFLGKRYIDLLKGKYFVNISRGELVDEKYLIEKIKKNFFKGVALDVIESENSDNNLQVLLKLAEDKHLILTPHIGGATYESMRKTEEFIVDKLIEKLKKG
jgi:D-3-phosphoglycerate dehydrogenase